MACQRAIQRQQLLCPHLACWHDRKVILESCRLLPAARTLQVAHASSISALGLQADSRPAAGGAAQASSIMEKAPPLASIHDRNMLGGDAEGAPPVPTLTHTRRHTCLGPASCLRAAQGSQALQYLAAHHPCPCRCCMAVAGGGLPTSGTTVACPTALGPRARHPGSAITSVLRRVRQGSVRRIT